MKIILIGLRGVGKTTIGQLLARELAMNFFDTDILISERNKLSVREIFAQKGEMEFREMETTILRELNKRTDDFVLATGGGIVQRPENQVLIAQLGKVIYLCAQPDLIRNRLKTSKLRPSLSGRALEEEIDFLYLTRDPLYRRCADLILPVVERSEGEICAEIREKLPEIKKRLPKLRKQP